MTSADDTPPDEDIREAAEDQAAQEGEAREESRTSTGEPRSAGSER